MTRYYYIHDGVRKPNKLRRFLFTATSLGVLGFGAYSLVFSPLKAKTAEDGNEAFNQVVQTPAVTVQTKLNAPMPWPNYGHSAYAVPEDNLAATSDSAPQQVPIASLAKVITALAILKEKPLLVGEQGPMITLNEQDIALYSEYIQKNGTVVPVEAGEQISQYQALQAIVMASSNNLSDSLAQRIFGSMDGYVTYANKMLKDLGLNETTVADASGYSPKTVSTAENMTRLGYIYMQNPVLREIAMQSEAAIPVAGEIRNYNSFMNEMGVIGIKVGDTDEAGKCFMVADIRQTGSGEKISIAVILGADNLRVAGMDAQNILEAGNKGRDQLFRNQ